MNRIYNSLEELLQSSPKVPIKKAKDLTGQTINYLTFICRVEQKNSDCAYWACKCKCGNYVKVRATHVLQNRTYSCGCYYRERMKTRNRKYYPNHEILLNKKFGLLTPIAYVGKDKSSHAIWKCICDCGNTTYVTATHLKTGHTTSCGCSKLSKYERRINEWLLEHNFIFSREYKIPELGNLRFDFKINLDNENFILIEMQGTQHYKPNSKFGLENFIQLQKNDKKKVDYCKENNINLLIIKYDENIEDILKSNLLTSSTTSA